MKRTRRMLFAMSTLLSFYFVEFYMKNEPWQSLFEHIAREKILKRIVKYLNAAPNNIHIRHYSHVLNQLCRFCRSGTTLWIYIWGLFHLLKVSSTSKIFKSCIVSSMIRKSQVELEKNSNGIELKWYLKNDNLTIN